jgi:hypothetical protein
MPAIVLLFAGTKNLCPGTRMARSYKSILAKGSKGLMPHTRWARSYIRWQCSK